MAIDYHAHVADRLPGIREAVERAAERAGRAATDVRMIAVTKGHPLDAVRAAVALGIGDVAENRVEELEEKVAAFGRKGVCWHMVGHVQRRKVPRVLGNSDLLHSVGSLRLAERVSTRWLDPHVQEAGAEGRFPVLLQVNTSGEGAKGGFAYDRAEDEIPEALELPGLNVRGLMTMAPFTGNEAVIRRTFRRLRELRDTLADAPGFSGTELSMGMTNDFTIAVEEGSTMIRLGTALFGERAT